VESSCGAAAAGRGAGSGAGAGRGAAARRAGAGRSGSTTAVGTLSSSGLGRGCWCGGQGPGTGWPAIRSQSTTSGQAKIVGLFPVFGAFSISSKIRGLPRLCPSDSIAIVCGPFRSRAGVSWGRPLPASVFLVTRSTSPHGLGRRCQEDLRRTRRAQILRRCPRQKHVLIVVLQCDLREDEAWLPRLR
jgi:hypothetical protein